jgi:hypothetical protein
VVDEDEFLFPDTNAQYSLDKKQVPRILGILHALLSRDMQISSSSTDFLRLPNPYIAIRRSVFRG